MAKLQKNPQTQLRNAKIVLVLLALAAVAVIATNIILHLSSLSK